jgi:hypothetical protein
MPNDQSKPTWEQQLRDAATHLEADLRRFATYVNDEIVPTVRREGSVALRDAAAELHKLAQRMEDHSRRTSSPPPSDAPKP